MLNLTKTKQKGFTLIELLVVVLVISILAGLLLSVINPQGIRRKARDSQRKADLKRVQTALELYFADNRAYPAATSMTNARSALSALNTGGAYINNFPDDPSAVINGGTRANNSVHSCSGVSNANYSYITNNTGVPGKATEYILVADMEVETSANDSLCHELNNATDPTEFYPCGAAPTCYGVENP